jgi:hypothetical protein
MNCWSSTKTAFMGQMWFIGFCAKIIIAPLLEKYGRLNILKRLLIPMNIIAFQLQYLSGPYYFLRCLGFLLSGMARIKMFPYMLILSETVESKHSAQANTLFYMFIFTVLLSFCIYIEYVSKNAINFLHFINGLCLICAAIFYTISVESPLRQIIDGDEETAMKSLNYISRFNAFFSRKDAY